MVTFCDIPLAFGSLIPDGYKGKIYDKDSNLIDYIPPSTEVTAFTDKQGEADMKEMAKVKDVSDCTQCLLCDKYIKKKHFRKHTRTQKHLDLLEEKQMHLKPITIANTKKKKTLLGSNKMTFEEKMNVLITLMKKIK